MLRPSQASRARTRGGRRRTEVRQLTKQDYDRAIADFTEGIGLDSSYAIAFNNRGWAYYVKQEYDGAIADYDVAIRLDPNSADTFDNRGRAHPSKQYYRAIADDTDVIRLDPKYAIAFNNCGAAYAARQDYDRAIADYTDVIRLDPRSAYSVLWLYLARTRSGAQSAAAELETNAKNLKQPDWPCPVVEVCLKQLSPLQPNPTTVAKHSSMSANGACCGATALRPWWH